MEWGGVGVVRRGGALGAVKGSVGRFGGRPWWYGPGVGYYEAVRGWWGNAGRGAVSGGVGRTGCQDDA